MPQRGVRNSTLTTRTQPLDARVFKMIDDCLIWASSRNFLGKLWNAVILSWKAIALMYCLLTGCEGRTRIYRPDIFHTARTCETNLWQKFSENSPIFFKKSFSKYFFTDFPKTFQSFLTSLEFSVNYPKIHRGFPVNFADEIFVIFAKSYSSGLFPKVFLNFSKILCSVLRFAGPYKAFRIPTYGPPFLQSDWLVWHRHMIITNTVWVKEKDFHYESREISLLSKSSIGDFQKYKQRPWQPIYNKYIWMNKKEKCENFE